MRIKGFSKMVEDRHLEPYILNDSTVVIDGHHLFYSMYHTSGLLFEFGAESDRFASFIKGFFTMFKKANVNCLFLIKGGHENQNMLNIHHDRKKELREADITVGPCTRDKIINPLLAKDIFLQTLQEMGYMYSVCCRNDIVEECSSLARELSCPVISFNMKYCFTADKYIPLAPEKKLSYDKNNNLVCGLFTRNKFIEDYKITIEKMILLILLCDTHLFDENTFNSFMNEFRLKLKFYVYYPALLRWLHLNSEEQALKKIFKHISEEDQSKFLEHKTDLQTKLCTTKGGDSSVAVLYFIDENQVQIKGLDPLWFEKGVCFHHIGIPYINLYYYKTLSSRIYIDNSDADSFILPMIDIMRYAYDLLTNFKGEPIIVNVEENKNDIRSSSTTYELSIKKPEYVAESSVFENGWGNIKYLHLFEHFLLETLQSFNFDALKRAPEDSRMLLIAMVYFSRKKTEDVTFEIYSIMLSYVMLNIVGEKVSILDARESPEIEEQPTLDPTTDKDLVSLQDSEKAASIMKKYFVVDRKELREIFDDDIFKPLIEFQGCLEELNRLNTLCGTPFPPTVYSKTYNGTFVYKVLRDMKRYDAKEFISSTLNPAPTVLAFVEGMLGVYRRVMYEY